jgi:diguanylate cyclase (GGDEF)-like protein/PAS domain S-box-containing protein
VNRALRSLLGRSEADLLGQPFLAQLHNSDADLLRRQMADGATGAAAFSMELRCRSQQGSDIWVVLHCGRFEDPGGAGDCLIYQLHDITSRRAVESKLQHIAFHDGLTDLANRQYFHERLGLAVERTRLDAAERFAVLFLDLDRFKMVNDSLGHLAGNELLCEVSRRLVACVRPSDLVARLGGDEFALLLEALHDPETGLRLADRVLHSLSQPILINGTEVVPGASVGITFSDLGYRTVDEVLRDADLAMYEAKAGGRGRVALFDGSMHERVADKLLLEGDLRRAIGEGQLDLHFQPIYDLQPYRLSGFEALARWVHPQRGPISPAVFIALAEESGRIEALTDWIVERSIAQLALWHQQMPETRDLDVHVNISGRDVARSSLVLHVQQALQRHSLPAAALTLEITETTLMGQLEKALLIMAELRETGVRFSIDDFGAGYSSLSYLATLPIDSLKIDRSFVMSMHEKPQNVEIVRAVLNLAQSLGRKVIAEGIETTEQLATLRQLGVQQGQGYLLSKPLRADEARDLLLLLTPACA